MDNSKCILQLRGERPFLSDKYDITKHPNYRLLSDEDPTRTFSVETEVSSHLQIPTNQAAAIYEMGSIDG